MTQEMKQFLYFAFASMAWSATVSRSSFYKKGASQADKDALRDFAKGKVIAIGRQIIAEESGGKSVMSNGKAHIRRINRLKNAVDKCHHIAVLPRKNFKFGRAQKFLNLYLKYMWCAGEISMPPHCPFDNIILGKLGVRCSCDKRKPWTNCDNPECYTAWVNEARKKGESKGLSIAEWECVAYSE